MKLLLLPITFMLATLATAQYNFTGWDQEYMKGEKIDISTDGHHKLNLTIRSFNWSGPPLCCVLPCPNSGAVWPQLECKQVSVPSILPQYQFNNLTIVCGDIVAKC